MRRATLLLALLLILLGGAKGYCGSCNTWDYTTKGDQAGIKSCAPSSNSFATLSSSFFAHLGAKPYGLATSSELHSDVHDKVTIANIEATFRDFLRQASSEDVVIVFMSMHCTDPSLNKVPSKLKRAIYPSMLRDGIMTGADVSNFLRERLLGVKSFTILPSKSSSYGHGIFAYLLLIAFIFTYLFPKVFRGEADYNGARILSLTEFIAYLEDKPPKFYPLKPFVSEMISH